MIRRAKVAVLLVLTLVIWVAAIARIAPIFFAPDASRQREELEHLARRAHAALRHEGPEPATYAAVVDGPSAGAWIELLAGAGVPYPKRVSASALPGLSARLVVGRGLEPAAIERLVEQGAAVVTIETSTTRDSASSSRTLRVLGVEVPSAATPTFALTHEAHEKPLAWGADGQMLGALAKRGAGAVVRLGVDLAELLVSLRQGEPGRAGVDTDQDGELKPNDLVPPYDPALARVPFADMAFDRLLAELDAALACPLIRSRALPVGVRKLLIVTADQDYEDDEHVLSMAELLARHGASATFLATDRAAGRPADMNVKDGAAPQLARESMERLLASGHGIGVHPFPAQPRDIAAHVRRFVAHAGMRPLIARNHHVTWLGYLDVPREEAALGIAMNLDMLPICSSGRPCVFFAGGSARPLAFLEHGRPLSILQQTTCVDDYSLRVPYGRLREAAQALLASARAALAVGTQTGSPIVLNAHPVFVRFAPEWLAGVLSEPGLTTLSAEAFLDFTLARRAVSVRDASCTTRPTVVHDPRVELTGLRP
jgi:hypothetical protein